MLFVWGWVHRRWVHVALGVSAATAIKLYPAMFFLVLVANRKWRILTLAGLATVSATLAIWAVFPGPLPEAVRGFLQTANFYSAPTAETVIGRNYSLLGGLLPLAVHLPGELGAVSVSWLLAHPWVPGGLYLLGCLALIVVSKEPSLTTISLTLAGLQLVPPINFRYYSVFALVVVALISRNFFVGDSQLRLPAGFLGSERSALLIASLLVTLLPLPLLLPGDRLILPDADCDRWVLDGAIDGRTHCCGRRCPSHLRPGQGQCVGERVGPSAGLSLRALAVWNPQLGRRAITCKSITNDFEELAVVKTPR